jgi:hypothetical protein
MNYYERYIDLSTNYKQDTDTYIKETNVEIKFFQFNSVLNESNNVLLEKDNNIIENRTFLYPVFIPGKEKRKRYRGAIVLLHGLNERSWDKYLTWAEYLCVKTNLPVILFPIAFHINRAPLSWSNPRKMMELLNFRKEMFIDDRSISFANVALSNRLSQNPERFYMSGRQTWSDLTSLFEMIKTGEHPLFNEDSKIDIFAYSIGAFLSQVALMANQKNLFNNSKLFMFCGGSIFDSMQGISRSIMDKAAFQTIKDYYINSFEKEKQKCSLKWVRDKAYKAFNCMISPEIHKTEREDTFSKLANQIKGITLTKDEVIPHHGVIEAMGKKCAMSTITLLDFDFPYSHENPFPVKTKDTFLLNKSFKTVFDNAVEFFL